MAADEQAKEGATKSEPPQQMMSEYVQRRHMIPDAQMAAVHILGQGCFVPEAKFDRDAGGGGEGAGQAQARLLSQCKKTAEVKDGTLNSAG